MKAHDNSMESPKEHTQERRREAPVEETNKHHDETIGSAQAGKDGDTELEIAPDGHQNHLRAKAQISNLQKALPNTFLSLHAAIEHAENRQASRAQLSSINQYTKNTEGSLVSSQAAKVLGEGIQNQLRATMHQVQTACDANKEKIRSLLLKHAAVPDSLDSIQDQCRRLLSVITAIKLKIKNSRLQASKAAVHESMKAPAEKQEKATKTTHNEAEEQTNKVKAEAEQAANEVLLTQQKGASIINLSNMCSCCQ